MQFANVQRVNEVARRLNPPRVTKRFVEIDNCEHVMRTNTGVCMRIYGFERWLPVASLRMPNNDVLCAGWKGTLRLSLHGAQLLDLI